MTASFWNGIIADHAASQLRATETVTPARDTYRGWEIWRGRWPEPEWTATSPNYDASYEGPEDGWVDNGQRAEGSTREELISNIDDWFAENEPAAALTRTDLLTLMFAAFLTLGSLSLGGVDWRAW